MSTRKPFVQKRIDSNIEEGREFSFQKTTQKKMKKDVVDKQIHVKQINKWRVEGCEKQTIDLLCGDLKRQNNDKMIEMIDQLRRQLKQKQDKNKLSQRQLSQTILQLKDVKYQYGRCLKEKSSLQQQTARLQRKLCSYQTRDQSKQEQIRMLQKKTEELNSYKSQLFDSKEQLKRFQRKYVDTQLTDENQKDLEVASMKETYEMKLQECEQHIREVERQNYQLSQARFHNQTAIKKLQLELQQSAQKLQRNSNSSKFFRLDHQSQCECSTKVQQLSNQVSSLKKQLQSTIEDYQIQLLELESESELQKYKTQTYSQHALSLQNQLNLIHDELKLAKSEILKLSQQSQDFEKKCLDYDALIQQIFFKLSEIQPESQFLTNYCEIMKDKFIRISQGKSISFLKNDTKNFISINSNKRKQHNYSSSKNKEQNYSFNTSFESYNKMKQWAGDTINQDFNQQFPNPHERNNHDLSPEHVNYHSSKNQKVDEFKLSKSKQQAEQDLENKILQERKTAQNRIRQNRQKYQKTSQKGFEKLSISKQNLRVQEPKQQTMPSRKDFRMGQKGNFYLTSEFDF